jgi:hypothetical protein
MIKELELAAPVSKGEQERFISELVKLDPAFASAAYDKTFGYEDRTKIFIKGKALGLKAIKALELNGWSKDGSWNSFNPALAVDFPVFSKNGEWPINIHINPLGVSFQAPTTDRVGEDTAFMQAMAKMAKAIMPGKAVLYLKEGTAKWEKSGGYAGGNIIHSVLMKAKALGFKPASFFGSSHPAGNWTSSDETYLHPDGWILSFGSGYGETKRSNSFWILLSVDYKRGEDKEALSKLPQPGTMVRFQNPSMGFDQVGIVKDVRNTRLLVDTGNNRADWVDVSWLKSLPKKGDSITFRSKSGEMTGTVDSLAYTYVIVMLTGDHEGRAYPSYASILTINGQPWA